MLSFAIIEHELIVNDREREVARVEMPTEIKPNMMLVISYCDAQLELINNGDQWIVRSQGSKANLIFALQHVKRRGW